MGNPSVAALIVTWNRRDDVLDCIRSLYAARYAPLSVWLVDNASSDGTCEAVAREYPSVRIIRSEKNLGFAAGNNLGIENIMAEGADALFLINNDAVVAEDTISILAEQAFSSHEVGVASPKILLHSQPDIVWSAGGMIDLNRGIATQRGYGEPDGGDEEIAEVDYAVGCALLVKTEVVKAVGVLDARYFTYFEEADWCRRIREAGYKVLYIPASRVWHKVTLSGNGRNQASYYFARNRLLYMHTAGVHSARVAWVAVSDLMRMAAAHAVHGKRDECRLTVKGVIDYYRRNFGRLR